jgi:hypothetical protein
MKGRRGLGWIVVLAGLAGFACGSPSETTLPDFGGDEAWAEVDGEAACDPLTCSATCISGGHVNGTCTGGVCQCTDGTDADADADVDAPVDGPGAEDAGAEGDVTACDPGECASSCVLFGFDGGHCDADGTCVCDAAADADADGDGWPDEGPDGDADGGADADVEAEAGCSHAACNTECMDRGCVAGYCSAGVCTCVSCPAADGDADGDGDVPDVRDDAAEAPDEAEAGDEADAREDAAEDGAEDAAEEVDGGTCTVGDFPEQVQCRSGFRCNLEGVVDGEAVPICDVNGTVGSNGICTDATPPGVTDDCARFFTCLSDGVERRCSRFCADHADCTSALGATSGCTWTLNDGSGGDVPGVRFCTDGCNARVDSGCDTGQTCRPIGDSSGFWTDCSRLGSGTQGTSCALGGEAACAAFHVCLGAGAAARCFRFCFADTDCSAVGSMSRCVYNVIDSGGTEIPGFDVCSEQCDAFADTVCTPIGEACRYGNFTGHGVASYCGDVGTGVQNAPCPGGDGDCQAGYSCWTVTGYGPICLQHCRLPTGTPRCSVPTTSCTWPGTGFPTVFGVCVPP